MGRCPPISDIELSYNFDIQGIVLQTELYATVALSFLESARHERFYIHGDYNIPRENTEAIGPDAPDEPPFQDSSFVAANYLSLLMSYNRKMQISR
jgi:hypothetical protein